MIFYLENTKESKEELLEKKTIKMVLTNQLDVFILAKNRKCNLGKHFQNDNVVNTQAPTTQFKK